MMINVKRVLLSFSTDLEKMDYHMETAILKGFKFCQGLSPLCKTKYATRKVSMLTLTFVNIQCTSLLFHSMQQNHVEMHNNIIIF